MLPLWLSAVSSVPFPRAQRGPVPAGQPGTEGEEKKKESAGARTRKSTKDRPAPRAEISKSQNAMAAIKRFGLLHGPRVFLFEELQICAIQQNFLR